MSDKSLSINLGVSEIVKEVKDTKTGEAIDQTSSLVIRAIHAALNPLEKWILQREFNIEATKKMLEKKLNDIPVEDIITPPSYIAVPALQAISYCMDNEELREMYAELLAHSMNQKTVDNVHPTFVEIIKQMSPFDATVFRELTKTLVQPCIGIKYMNKRTKASYPVQDIVAFDDLERFPLVLTQVSLENLERLRLIEINKTSKYNDGKKYDVLIRSVKEISSQFIRDNSQEFDEDDYEIVYNEYVILIRGFGQFFARACLGENFNNLDKQ